MTLSNSERIALEKDLNLRHLSKLNSDRQTPVANCWHFYSDGRNLEFMFSDRGDFKAGMNRVYVLTKKYEVIILAFILMDTHFHFVLHGEYDECLRFTHEFLRRTSQHISLTTGERNKLIRIPLSHQKVDNVWYLKTVICYVVKNAPVGGLRFIYNDYPWSSGSLYFRSNDEWTSPSWTNTNSLKCPFNVYASRNERKIIAENSDRLLSDGIVFPGDYVAYEEVEQLFRSHKGFHYFICKAKEDDVESIGGTISMLSIPIQELRLNRDELTAKYFGKNHTRSLNTKQRICLAKGLKSRFNCSDKQIARLCGLRLEELSGLI